jgi:hypothetical protein
MTISATKSPVNHSEFRIAVITSEIAASRATARAAATTTARPEPSWPSQTTAAPNMARTASTAIRIGPNSIDALVTGTILPPTSRVGGAHRLMSTGAGRH